MNAYKTCTTLDGPYTQMTCSECKQTMLSIIPDYFKFCWHCGAKFGPKPKPEPTSGDWYYVQSAAKIYARSPTHRDPLVGEVTGDLRYVHANGYLMAASKKLLAACHAALRTGIPSIDTAKMVSDAISEAEKGMQ